MQRQAPETGAGRAVMRHSLSEYWRSMTRRRVVNDERSDRPALYRYILLVHQSGSKASIQIYHYDWADILCKMLCARQLSTFLTITHWRPCAWRKCGLMQAIVSEINAIVWTVVISAIPNIQLAAVKSAKTRFPSHSGVSDARVSATQLTPSDTPSQCLSFRQSHACISMG